MVAQAITVVNRSSKGRSSNNDYKAAAVTAVRTELALLALVAAEVAVESVAATAALVIIVVALARGICCGSSRVKR